MYSLRDRFGVEGIKDIDESDLILEIFSGTTLDVPDHRKDDGERCVIIVVHLRGRMVVIGTPRGGARLAGAHGRGLTEVCGEPAWWPAHQGVTGGELGNEID